MLTLDKEDLTVVFMEDDPEDTCQKTEGCSKVAIWEVTWKHTGATCGENDIKLYCNEHMQEFREAQKEVGVGAYCGICYTVMILINYRLKKA